MREDELTIILTAKESDGIPVGSFKCVLDNMIGMLRDVEPVSTRDRRSAVEWRITDAAFNSPFRFAIGPARRSNVGGVLAVASVIAGMRLLENGTHTFPPRFEIGTLQHAKAVVEVLSKDISSIKVVPANAEAFACSQRIAAQVDELLPGEHWEIGSIEGDMETLTIHSGTEFVIWDRITGARVVCALEEKMLPDATKAFGKRVSVSGKIHYAANCRPDRIKVERFFEFPEQADLPQFADLRGILENI